MVTLKPLYRRIEYARWTKAHRILTKSCAIPKHSMSGKVKCFEVGRSELLACYARGMCDVHSIIQYVLTRHRNMELKHLYSSYYSPMIVDIILQVGDHFWPVNTDTMAITADSEIASGIQRHPLT